MNVAQRYDQKLLFDDTVVGRQLNDFVLDGFAWSDFSKQASILQIGSPVVVGHDYPHYVRLVFSDNDLVSDSDVLTYLEEGMFLPFKNESFDLVIVPYLYQCFDNNKYFFEEVYRVLKPEGTLLIAGLQKLSLLYWQKAYVKTDLLSWVVSVENKFQFNKCMENYGFDYLAGKDYCGDYYRSSDLQIRMNTLTDLSLYILRGGVSIKLYKKSLYCSPLDAVWSYYAFTPMA